MSTLGDCRRSRGIQGSRGEFNAWPPALAVKQLNLHAGPKRLDDGVVEAVSNRTHAWEEQAKVDRSSVEGP